MPKQNQTIEEFLRTPCCSKEKVVCTRKAPFVSKPGTIVCVLHIDAKKFHRFCPNCGSKLIKEE